MRRYGWIEGTAIAAAGIALSACVTRTPAPIADRKPPQNAPLGAATEPAAGTLGPASSSPSSLAVPAPEPVQPPPPPQQPDWRPEFYTVKRGDTLFQIALEHGLDYRELAALNNVENINVIRVGQVLRVRPPGAQEPANVAAGSGPQTAPLVTVPPVTDAKPVAPTRSERANSETFKTQPKAIRLPYSEAALAQLQAQGGGAGGAGGAGAGASAGGSASGAGSSVVVVPGSPVSTSSAGGSASGSGAGSAGGAPAAPIGPLASAAPGAGGIPQTPAAPPIAGAPAGETSDEQLDWAWPVRGRIISGFSESASLKGIDIAGSKGVPVQATAAGRVVYAGSGLRGYGKLVIVKHNKTFLSAYAHLDEIGVREGQNVTKGQAIGKMGSTDADQVKLHFEIRSLGKPVDPMRYLPKG